MKERIVTVGNVVSYIEVPETEADFNKFKRAVDMYKQENINGKEARFLFNLKNHKIYDARTSHTYRCVAHSFIFAVHNLEEQQDDILRLSFYTLKYLTGEYTSCDLGITGLKESDLYEKFLSNKIFNRLSKQDLDIIENYINDLKQEWEELSC